MLARWVSATDPMTVAETSDINANTRNNNNIVWRNLNIVDLSADQEVEVSMDVSNPSKFASQIVFQDLTKFPTRPFFKTGQITIIPDEALLKIWVRGKAKPVGFKFDGKSMLVTSTLSSLDNLIIPPDFKGKIKIRFKKNKYTPNSEFHFSVKQYLFGRNSKKSILGGVDYTIQNFITQ